MDVDEKVCRCERCMPRGQHCDCCMGHTCDNITYRYRGELFRHIDDATLLWTCNSYDGPLSGIAVCNHWPCWAVSYTFYRDRAFWMYPLTVDEWDAECKRHVYWLGVKGILEAEVDRAVYTRRKPLGFARLRPEHYWNFKFNQKNVASMFEEWV